MNGGLRCESCGARTCVGPECSACWMRKQVDPADCGPIRDLLAFQDAARAPVGRGEPATIHDLARRAAEVNGANGWEPSTWYNLVPKMAFALTEVDELIDALHAGDDENIREETADIVIRVASALYDWREDDWCSRIEHRHRFTSGRYAPPEVLVRPISSHLLKGIEAWRKGRHKDVQQHMELSLLACYRLSDQLGFDLTWQVERKIEINRGRGRHHGKASGLG